MHPNESLIRSFYEAFGRRDAEAMAACYHPEVRFSDPVFRDLQGRDAGDMWRMLCARAEGLEIRCTEASADAESGRAHWDADYRFSQTGRQVNNHIDARFRFQDGLIVEHLDDFDLWAWTRMALGPAGWLLGWSGLVQGKVRGQAMAGLRSWQARHGAGPGAGAVADRKSVV